MCELSLLFHTYGFKTGKLLRLPLVANAQGHSIDLIVE